MPAGWYPDPSSPGWMRWWDGSAWTAHVSPAGWGAAAVVDPQRDLHSELSSARYARIAMLALGAVQLVQFVLVASFAGRIAHDFKKALDQANADPNATPNPFSDHGVAFFAGIVAIDGFNLLMLGAEVVIVIWLFQAMTCARRLGISARRSPVWAILGFIVPVVSFWFPYQCAVDLFERGDQHRRLVGWWWACWLIDSILLLPIGVISWFSVPVALLGVVLVAVVPITAARCGAAFVAAAGEAHRARLATAANPSG